MPSFVKAIFGIGLILGGFFGLSAAMYGIGYGLERLRFENASEWWAPLATSHLAAILILMLVIVMVTATLLTLAERKWSAFMQDRPGPNRARLGGLPVVGKLLENMPLAGLPHIPADVVKMLTKESFRPRAASPFLFNLAPILAFAPVFALSAVIPMGPALSVAWDQGKSVLVQGVAAAPDFGILYMFAIASLAVYGTSLAGWASNNKFALLGGVRAASQMISYEVALGLSLVGMMIAFSTVKLAGDDGLAAMQGQYLWSFRVAGFDLGVPQWGIFLQPIGFLLFFAAAFAETKRAPFDTPEGESEIVGYFIEYSGMQFGMFMISEFVEVVVLSAVLTAVFFGAWWPPFGNEALKSALAGHEVWLGAVYGLIFWVKALLLIYLQLVIRWTFPRFRYDQVQHLGWKILLPLGLINVFVSGALILWDPSLRSLCLMGVLEMAVFGFWTLTPPRQVRQEAEARADHDGHDHGHDTHAAPALGAGSH